MMVIPTVRVTQNLQQHAGIVVSGVMHDNASLDVTSALSASKLVTKKIDVPNGDQRHIIQQRENDGTSVRLQLDTVSDITIISRKHGKCLEGPK
ncbi:hypothetical protein, partial [Streptococcus dysgalactiae]|uniref:hypothetical protein n=1 Tax=Streptococcus dysgalactiae TaxID=1334 RepID=UPI0019512007